MTPSRVQGPRLSGWPPGSYESPVPRGEEIEVVQKCFYIFNPVLFYRRIMHSRNEWSFRIFYWKNGDEIITYFS